MSVLQANQPRLPQAPYSTGAGRITRIAPSRGWVSLRLRELWDHRELIYFLIWRDVKVRYKQTVLGATWAILQPFISMLIFTLVFGKLAKLPSDGIPYAIFSYTALVQWTLFASGTSRASSSIVGSRGLVKKVYFPRLAVPLASVAACFADYIPAFGMLLLMMIYYHVAPGWQVLWVPFFVALATATAVGVGLWLAALNVRFRDIGYVTPFLIQIWFFMTPVVYPTSLLPARWRFLYGLNPMASSIQGFRWALLGSGDILMTSVFLSSIGALVLLFSGAVYFRRMERRFEDII